ncbi:MAG: hypothetical protein ACFFAO_06405 [Candidatus Hermodarchaeota archaeon]
MTNEEYKEVCKDYKYAMTFIRNYFMNEISNRKGQIEELEKEIDVIKSLFTKILQENEK